MNYSSVTDIVFSRSDESCIDCIVNVESIGLIPFTASALDIEPHGIEIYNRCVAGDFGPIAPYVEPEEVIIVPSEVSMRQARLALTLGGFIGTVNAAIESMVEPDKSLALIEWEYASSVERESQFVQSMQLALGLTDTELDDLFISASQL